ncbi:protein of unknown function [Hyphomicrobium sp. 1Nfss2.1]|uniref:hypothetical protein n=1 Tax=Hyphomicrobium sp. 1Nfss2.1 TaxID=3413936 RepID=UPI003C7BF44B
MAEEHHHDPTLDPRTCARLDALEEAILNGNVVPLQTVAAGKPVAPEMTARLAEHDARVSEVIQQATEAFEAISRSDSERITALEQQVTKIQDILVNLAERWGKQ